MTKKVLLPKETVKQQLDKEKLIVNENVFNKSDLLESAENIINELKTTSDNLNKIKEYFLNHVDININSLHEIEKLNYNLKNIKKDLNKVTNFLNILKSKYE